MNKNDKILIVVILVPILIFCLLSLINNEEATIANVYYENNKVLSIDLNNDEKKYTVDGYNGSVEILAGNGKIKVIAENSPLHLCSIQGYISKSYETIICLPNKIVIKIEDSEEFDATL